MKEPANRQWQELGHDVTTLRGKVDVLDVKFEQVDTKLKDLIALAETARLITYLGVILVMVTLLINHWNI